MRLCRKGRLGIPKRLHGIFWDDAPLGVAIGIGIGSGIVVVSDSIEGFTDRA